MTRGWSRVAVVAVLVCLAPVLAGCGNSSTPTSANRTSGSAAASASSTSTASPATAVIAREDLALHFGGYVSHAQLTYPAGGGRRPVVVLIPGSSSEDRNADVCQARTGKVLSHNFADIATHLSARGYAVMRYDKRGVTGRCQGSIDYTLPQLLADAVRVLSAAEHSPHVDAHRVFVYGWSEGSTVAAALGLAHPEVAGLIVQGAVVGSWPSIFDYQVLQVGVPYLRSFAPDGRVDSALLAQASAGDGGLFAKTSSGMSPPLARRRAPAPRAPRATGSRSTRAWTPTTTACSSSTASSSRACPGSSPSYSRPPDRSTPTRPAWPCRYSASKPASWRCRP